MSIPIGKKLLAFHIARLKDKNADVRLKSIHELAQLGDAEALPVLEELFKNDSDSEVRRAAQEAGKTIYNANKSVQK